MRLVQTPNKLCIKMNNSAMLNFGLNRPYGSFICTRFNLNLKRISNANCNSILVKKNKYIENSTLKCIPMQLV